MHSISKSLTWTHRFLTVAKIFTGLLSILLLALAFVAPESGGLLFISILTIVWTVALSKTQIGLLKVRPWARTLAIAFAITWLGSPLFPLCIATLFELFNKDLSLQFSRREIEELSS